MIDAPAPYDAAIVGFGPVGATLANLLARAGLRVAVAEAARDIYPKPRAITLDHEVMRIFQACGLADRIAPFTTPHPGTDYLGVDGRIIKRFDPLPPPHPLGWPPTGTFLQPEVERRLRAGLADSPGADVFLGEAVVALEPARDSVALVLDSGRVVQARYGLACDGANSFVRRALGIALEDLAFDEWWMVVDVRLTRPVALPAKCIQYCRPSRPATFVIGPGNLRRWEIKMLPGETPDDFGRPENVRRLLAAFVDPNSIEIWRSAVYRFHALLAGRWSEGRIYLLGDACHQTPPFLGQGMCAGIRDAGNLAWKLAAVLRDGASDRLLQSYERERKPHVRALVATAKEFGRIIGELDPVVARLRDDRLHSELEHGQAETVRQRFVPNLIDGVIDRHPDAKAAGTLFVQPRVRSAAGPDRLLDDLVAPRFVIATGGVSAHEWATPDSVEKWRRLKGERLVIRARGAESHGPASDGIRYFIEADGLFTEWLARHGSAAAVVRPDRYVFGLADGPDVLNRLISDVYDHVFGSGGSRQ